jgi:hypothetical protein
MTRATKAIASVIAKLVETTSPRPVQVVTPCRSWRFLVLALGILAVVATPHERGSN